MHSSLSPFHGEGDKSINEKEERGVFNVKWQAILTSDGGKE